MPTVVQKKRTVHADRNVICRGETVDHVVRKQRRSKTARGKARYKQGIRFSDIRFDGFHHRGIVGITVVINGLFLPVGRVAVFTRSRVEIPGSIRNDDKRPILERVVFRSASDPALRNKVLRRHIDRKELCPLL